MAKRQTAQSSRWTAYLFMLINTITWGAAIVIVKPSLEITTPFRFLLYRYIIAGLLGLPIIWYYWKKFRLSFKQFWQITLIELLGTGAALWLIYEGLKRTAAIEAGLLTSAQPLFVILVGVWLFKERLEKNELAGLSVAFLGTLLLTLVPLFVTNHSLKSLALTGNLLIIMSLILNGFYYPLTKKYYRKIPKLFASALSFYVGLVFFGLLSLAEVSFSIDSLVTQIGLDLLSLSVLVASVYMAVFGSLIGYTALIKGLEGIEASEAVLFNYLQPLVYIPLGVVLLKESVHPLQLTAMVIIFIGVFVAEKRFKKITP